MSYRYDPELLAAADAAPRFDLARPSSARDTFASLGASLPPFEFPAGVSHRREVVVTAFGGVDVHVIRPVDVTASPVLIWFHGGGFVFGNSAMDFALNTRLVLELSLVVISVDYRLAPEYPYPTAVEEGLAVLQWVYAERDALDIDGERIAVAGHSAGACLAAAVSLAARDRGGPAICFQALDLPVTDDRLDTPSMREFENTPIWTRTDAEASWAAYRGAGPAARRPYAAPLRAVDLRGLPPAYVSVAEFDPLRDEGIAYAQRLVQSGVSTELHLFPGTFHGSVAAVPDAAISRSMVAHLTGALARAFARTTDTPTDREPEEVST